MRTAIDQLSMSHIKKYANINGKVVEDTDIIEENKNGHIKIKIRELAKPKCSPFRRNHLLFTNKHRGFFNKRRSIRQKLDTRAKKFRGNRKALHKKTQKNGYKK